MKPEDIHKTVDDIKAAGPSKARVGRDPVNQPMIRHWVDAIGDDNRIYVDEAAAKAAGHPGVVAPPAMIQVWTMMGLGGDRPGDDPIGPIMELFDGAGFVGVVATNCDQTYHRYLRPGEDVSVVAELTDVVGPKNTALGEGYFISQRITWQVGDEDVAEMDWRILKFRPADADQSPTASVPQDLDADAMMRPASSRDTKFFWDGVNAHELRIQKRADGTPAAPAGARALAGQRGAGRLSGRERQGNGVQLRHPPRARRCPAVRFRSSSRSSNSRKGFGCSASSAASIQRLWRSECLSAQRISTSPRARPGRRGRCTHGSLDA